MRMHMPVQVDGKSIPAYKALYVATVQDSSDTLDQASTLTHELYDVFVIIFSIMSVMYLGGLSVEVYSCFGMLPMWQS